MRTTTMAYDDSDKKNPRVIVEFNGVTREYSSGEFSSISANTKKFLSDFNFDFGRIDLLKGSQTPTTMRFTIVDKDDDVTSTLNSDPLVDLAVTAKFGFSDIAEADFVSLPAQKMNRNPELASDLQTWSFATEDIRRLLKGKISRSNPRTALDADLGGGASETAISVADESGFGNADNMQTDWPQVSTNRRLFVRIDDEILSYRDTTAGSLDANGGFIGRSLFGSTAGAHADGATVTQAYCFAGMWPTEALLHILMTTEDGTGHAHYDLASFDSSFQGMGYGFSDTEVDVEGIERLGYKVFELYYENCTALYLTEPADGLKWITDNILKPGGLILYVNSDGKISCTSIDYLEFQGNFSSVNDINKDDILLGSMTFEIDYRSLINHIRLERLENPFPGAYSAVIEAKLGASETAYGLREDQYEIKSKLIQRNDSHYATHIPNDLDLVRVVCRRWLRSFANPLGIARWKSTPDQWLMEPTDSITITNDKMPDVSTGSRGWTSKKFFITGQSIAPLQNDFNFTAFTWEAMTDVSLPSKTTISSGSIDDASLAFNSDNTVTIDTEDAYWDVDQSYSYDAILFKLSITPPNTGTSYHSIRLDIKDISISGGTITNQIDYRAIRYYSGDSAAFDVFLFFHDGDGSMGTDTRLKIDWYDGTAGASERPSAISISEIQIFTTSDTLTLL